MAPLPGSLGDLVTRAEGRPIYCAASGDVRRALMDAAINGFRCEHPEAEFVNALTHYRHADDRRLRWPRERARYGAAIVVTRAENTVAGADPFAGLSGEHVINVWVALAISDLRRLKRPIAWHAVVFPAAYWQPRFAVEPFEWLQTSRWARLLPATDPEIFCPAIGGSPIGIVNREPAQR
jgi:hypothetical protein